VIIREFPVEAKMADEEVVRDPPTEEELLMSSFVVFSSDIPRVDNMREAVLTFRFEERKWTDLPEGTFTSTARLSVGPSTCIAVMIMKHHHLTSLPKDFHEIGSHMMHLNLSYNKIRSFGLPNPSSFVSLNELLMTGNGLKTFDPSIRNLPCLKVLDVSNNLLEEIPSCIAQLKGLKTMNASFNNIRSICKDVDQMSQLTELELQNNKLKQLPVAFSRLQVEILHLSCNCLGNQAMEIVAGISSLQELYVAHNCISVLPMDVRLLTNLKRLVTDGNPITSPPVKHCRRGVSHVQSVLQSKFIKSGAEGILQLGSGSDIYVANNPCYESDPERDYQTDSD
jgi:Leucine-rich repeat (LRR) protein